VYKGTVVPLDGSGLAERAMVHARDASRFHDAPIFLVRAVDPPVTAQRSVMRAGSGANVVYPTASCEQEDRDAREYIDREVQRVRQAGFSADGIVMWGPAAPAVASAINDTDLIVMSSLGRTGIRRSFLGSVAEDILKRTSVPVLIVRQPTEA
jgi:nucleotide-binding universal stress UspA family protein